MNFNHLPSEIEADRTGTVAQSLRALDVDIVMTSAEPASQNIAETEDISMPPPVDNTRRDRPYPPPATLPTQTGPNGIRFDFNLGARGCRYRRASFGGSAFLTATRATSSSRVQPGHHLSIAPSAISFVSVLRSSKAGRKFSNTILAPLDRKFLSNFRSERWATSWAGFLMR